jgi:diadenosine tetraphosphatase ApaH/serine/threonine PP2A family protein phosphatase
VRYGVLGDIHGNLEALTSVLADAQEAGVGRLLCVGDVVGYGADPHECLKVLRDGKVCTVAGNHDWAVVEKVGIEYFNADARDSIEWTRDRLSSDELEYLGGLPLIEVMGEITVVHSSPFSPEYYDYVQTLYDVQLAFDHMRTRLCFVGHSHVPVMFLNTEPVEHCLRPVLELAPDRRVIVNVGSVGQPRDLDPRACYAIWDTDEQKVYLRRVDYDQDGASRKIAAAGLPITNARRIVLGR